jgi:hypothetical protein
MKLLGGTRFGQEEIPAQANAFPCARVRRGAREGESGTGRDRCERGTQWAGEGRPCSTRSLTQA